MIHPALIHPHTLTNTILEIDRSRNISSREKKKKKKRAKDIAPGEVCRQLESLRMVMTRDRGVGGLERGKKV